MHAMRQESAGKERLSYARSVDGILKVKKIRTRDQEGVKATIPDGEHPFDYLFEGHQFNSWLDAYSWRRVEVLEVRRA